METMKAVVEEADVCKISESFAGSLQDLASMRLMPW